MLERATRECSDVADDGDVEALERPEGSSHGVEVEQALGRVLVRPVTGVHDVGLASRR